MAKMSIDQALVMGEQHLHASRFAEAETVGRIVAQSWPQDHRAYHLLALVACHTNRFAEAGQLLNQALALNPNDPTCYTTRAVLCRMLGQFEAAVEAARRALSLHPTMSEAENNLGCALASLGRVQEGEAALRRALSYNPSNASAMQDLATLLQDRGQLTEAEGIYHQALALRPQYPEAHANLGVLLQAMNRQDEAEAAYRRALALRPDFCEAESNLGSLLYAMGRIEEAEAACRRAIALRPDHGNAFTNLGAALHAEGRVEDARDAYQRAAQLRPDFAFAHSSALFSEQYIPDVTLAHLAKMHAEWDPRHGDTLRAAWTPHTNVRDPEKQLRVGMVSADLYNHPVGIFSYRGWEAFDRRAFALVFYNDRPAKDALTVRLAATAALWRDTRGITDADLAQQVRKDGIDILFDLSGHGMGNRLQLFARKPAPIQITWLGYEGTTGMKAMDYILADRYQIAEGEEQYYSEKVLRMPDSYVCYLPPPGAPPVGPLPMQQRGVVTFASFNNLAKITPQVLSVWGRILRSLPGSRLMLKYKGLEKGIVRDRYLGLLAAEEIPPDRLILDGWTPHIDSLHKYNQVDIGLDPFPFSGSLTTCDALWMGVPVITWPGRTFAGRHTLGHLSTIGMTELIARDPEHYVELALQLAQDLPRLEAMRAGLRDRVAQSPLCDGRRYADNLMQLLRGAWRQWVAEHP